MTHTAAQALGILGEEDIPLDISAWRTAASEPGNTRSVAMPYTWLVGWVTNRPSSAQINLFKKNEY